MNEILAYLSRLIGVDATTLVLLIGLVVAVANVIGKRIPASATGFLGTLRKICLLIGLYVPQQITPNVSTKTVAKALAAEVPDELIVASAQTLPEAIAGGISQSSNLVSTSLVDSAAPKPRSKSAKVSSPWIVGVLGILVTLLLTGCTTDSQARVESAIGTVCSSAPIAQSLYNTALASGDQSRVNQVLNYLQLACPAVLILVHTIPVKVEVQVPPTPPLPSPGPERG